MRGKILNEETSHQAIKIKISKNKRNLKDKKREKFGIKIPNSTREALLIDTSNGDNKWGEAIANKIDALERLNFFEYYEASKRFWREEGWQFAPMQMIFDIKQDLRRKARFVVGGHIIDSLQHNTYSSTVKDISVRLLMLAAVKNGLSTMTGDIGNAFCTSPCAEKYGPLLETNLEREEAQWWHSKGLYMVLRQHQHLFIIFWVIF
jgi:hypothetical protein